MSDLRRGEIGARIDQVDLMLQSYPRTRVGLFILSAVSFAAAAGVSRLGPMAWLVDVLLLAGIVLATCAGSVLGAAMAFAAAAFLTFGMRDVELAEWSGEVIEWIIVISSALFARNRIVRSRRSERKVAALFASLEDAAFVFDETGRCVEAWGPLERLAAPARNLRGKPIADVLPGTLASLMVGTLRRALAEHRSVSIDYELRTGSAPTWWNAVVTAIDSRHVLWIARDITVRKMAETELHDELEGTVEALRQSERLHRGIVEQARDIIFTLDPAGRFTSLNPAFEATTGWPAEMWIGRSFRDLLPPRIQALGDAVFADVARSAVMPLTRTLVQARDARLVMLELSLVNQKVEGETVAFLGFGRDVTQREESQKELRRSQRQLADTQRIAQLGSWEHDLVRGRLWWSEEHYRLFGFDPSEPVTYDRFRSRLAPDQLQKLNAFDALLSEKGEGESEIHVIASDGTTKILNCVGRLERNSEGHPIRIFGSAQDVTERRRDERRLRESDERFRLMSRATNDVVWDWNLSSDVCWWGDGLHAFGYDAAGFSAIHFWRSRIHPEDAVRVESTIAAARGSQAPSWVCDYRFRRADGTYAYVLDRAYIVRDEQEVAVRMVGAITDVTERRKMQEQLAEANRLSSLGRVAASVAHEFNNVLMGMQSNLEVLRRRAPVQLMKTVEHILHSVRRGKRITDEVLACTRQTAPSLQDVLVATFLTHWQEEIRPLIGPSIELVLEVAPELYMRADPLQIAQVLTNLALNGRDAMPGGGLLQIRAGHAVGVVDVSRSTGAVGYVHFQVRDHGVGMSVDDLSHIFEPLFTTKHGGTGLGLAVSYQIISRHDGFISAESEPGRGTTFNLLLPAASVTANVVIDAPAASLACRSIVIIDDDESVVAGLQALLRLDDIRVAVATRGGDAIPLLEKEMPDAVILDIGLPDMNGSEVYERIAQRWPTLPVLFASGHADAARLDAWLRRPNVGFLLKPYDYATLRLALSELVGDGRGRDFDDPVKDLHVM